MKQIPAPIYRKMLTTALIGGGCFLFGLIYYIAVKDYVLLLLSAVLLVNCGWKVFSIYRIAVKGTYEVVEGTCVGINTHVVGKFKTIKMMDDAGTETTLRLAKNCKLRIGDRYRLYFDNRNQFQTGSGFFDKVLATGDFLGYEPAPESIENTEEHRKNN